MGYLLLAPLSLWLSATFALPMATLVALSVQADTSIFAPLGPPLTLNHLWAVLSDGYYLSILGETFWLGLQVTFWSALLGFPVALWLARLGPRWRPFGIALVLIPLLTNVVVRSLGLLQLLAPNGPLPTLLAWLSGQDGGAVNLLFTQSAVVIALTQVFAPFLIMALYDSLQDLDRRLLDAAGSLGAPPLRQFWQVTFPLALPGLRAGVTLVFLLATTSYVSATLLGGKKVWTIGMVIYEEALQIQNYPQASALAMVLLAVCALTTYTINRIFAHLTPWAKPGHGIPRRR